MAFPDEVHDYSKALISPIVDTGCPPLFLWSALSAEK